MLKTLIAFMCACLASVICLTACGDAPALRTVNARSTNGAELTLYSFDGTSESVFGIPVLGHAFIALKNTGSGSIEVYGYEIEAGAETTIGGWGQSAKFGIWFNIEGHYMTLGRYKGIVSVSQTIDTSVIEKMSDYMSGNDEWTPTENCSYLALALWNIAGGGNEITIDGLVTPAKLKREIERFTSYKTDRLSIPQKDAAYKENGVFVFCRLDG